MNDYYSMNPIEEAVWPLGMLLVRVVRINGRIDRIARYQTSRRAPELPVPPVTEDGSRIR